MPGDTLAPPEVIAEAIKSGDIKPAEMATDTQPPIEEPPAPAETDAPPLNPTDPQAEDSDEPTETPTTEINEKRTKTKEKVESVGKSVVRSATERVRRKYNKMTPEEQKIWDKNPANINEKRTLDVHGFSTLDNTSFKDESGEPIPMIDIANAGNPLIVRREDQQISLKEINTISEEGVFTCKGETTDAEGNKAEIPVEVPIQEIVNAQVIAERDAISATLPPRQRELFNDYVDLLTARINGEEPFEEKSEEDLTRIEKAIEKAQEPSEHYKEEEVPMKIIELADDEKDGKKIQKEVNDALEQRAREKGVSVKQLSKEDNLDVQGEVTDRHFEAKLKEAGYENVDPEFKLGSEDQAMLGNWKIDFFNRNQEAPTPEQIKEYARKIIYARVTQQDRMVIGNEKRYAELIKTMSKKEKTALFALLAGILMWPIAEGIAPLPSER